MGPPFFFWGGAFFLSSSSGEHSETGGPSGAEGELFRQGVRDSFALMRAAGSPGQRREDAACRRMTKAV